MGNRWEQARSVTGMLGPGPLGMFEMSDESGSSVSNRYAIVHELFGSLLFSLSYIESVLVKVLYLRFALRRIWILP